MSFFRADFTRRQRQLQARQEERFKPITVKPTYGVDNYGQDIYINLIDNLTQGTFTNSDATILRDTVTTGSDSVTTVGVDDFPIVIANENTLVFNHAGDDTDFDRSYRFEPDMTAMIYKLEFNIAFITNISAYTSNGVTFDNVRVRIYERGFGRDAQEGTTLYDRVFATGHNQLTAANADIYILDAVIRMVKVHQGFPIDFRFTCTNTQVATNTYQSGIVPMFSYMSSNNPKPYSVSGILMHLHPTLDHAAPVFQDKEPSYRVDVAGVPQKI